jgi:hypothetical protein
VQRQLDIPHSAEVAGDAGNHCTGIARKRCDGDRVGDFDGKRLGFQPPNSHDYRRVKIGTVQVSKYRHRFAHLGQPLPR